jgi:hypothetical protein
MYDIAIIGAGISGLYSAYKIKKQYAQFHAHNKSFIVLEKEHRSKIGGRVGNVDFHGAQIAKGAGVLRTHKDHSMIRLLKELHVKTKPFIKKQQYASTIPNPPNMKHLFESLKHIYIKEGKPHVTFRQFARPLLGKTNYDLFMTCAGYRDFEHGDAHDFFYGYGFEDNIANWTGLSLNWNDLIDRLVTKIGAHHIKTSKEVVKCEPLHSGGFEITTSKGERIYARKVVLATQIPTVQHIMKSLPNSIVDAKQRALYNQIKAQPFLRVYGHFDRESAEIMAAKVPVTTIVPGPIYKIIPVDPTKGIYMICYNDNAGAETLKRYAENTQKNRTVFARLLETALGLNDGELVLTSIRSFYWPLGTHFYFPLLSKYGFKTRKDFLHAVQTPYPFMRVVGEAVAEDTGWTNGAVESVDAVLNHDFILM